MEMLSIVGVPQEQKNPRVSAIKFVIILSSGFINDSVKQEMNPSIAFKMLAATSLSFC